MGYIDDPYTHPWPVCVFHTHFKVFLKQFSFVVSDNIFSIKSWTKKKFAFDENRINKAFGIPEDFDYLDWLTAFFF